MGGDVAAAAAPGVGAQPVPDPAAEKAEAAAGSALPLKGGFVLHAEFEHGAEIGRRPVAVQIAVGKAVVAVAPHAPQGAPAVHGHDRLGAGGVAADARLPRRWAK